MHSASDAQCQCAVCVCSLQKLRPWALEPRGALSLARQCQHRNTHGRRRHAEPAHGAEQCAGLAEGFEEECEREHLGRRVTGASHQLMRKCHEGAGRNFLGEVWNWN